MLGSAPWSGLRVLKLLWVFIQDEDVLAGNKSKGALQLMERSAQETRQKLLSLKHLLHRHKVLTPVLYFCTVSLDHTNYITPCVVMAGKFKE